MMQRLALGLLALTTGLLASSCSGYRLGPAKPELLAHVQTLAIPTFVNETLEPRIAVQLTNATIKSFMTDSSYKIAPRDRADAVLVVEIKDVRRAPFRFNRGNRLVSRELNFTILCDYYVEDLVNGDILIEGKAMGSANMAVDGDNFQLSERQAITAASRNLATEIMSEVSEGW